MDTNIHSRIGQIFGKCRIQRLIGKGGMGKVWLGEHLFLKRKVAIKILGRDLSNDPEEMARFEKEAIAAAALDHENIVTIYDIDEVQGRPFIVMEYVEGEDLEQHLQRKGPMPVMRAAEVVLEVCKALEHAHHKGMVHRDIKPGNILLGRDGRIKLTDFGLAMEMGKQELIGADGTVTGTPHYASPEQIQGLPMDGRSDIYSLGVTFYAMLTGIRPFNGRTPDSVVRKHIEAPRPSAKDRRPTLAPTMDAVVKRMMAVNREERYATVRAVKRDLDLFLSARPFLRVHQPARPGDPAPAPPPSKGTTRKGMPILKPLIKAIRGKSTHPKPPPAAPYI
jgi:serine/threonine-protein kinase